MCYVCQVNEQRNAMKLRTAFQVERNVRNAFDLHYATKQTQGTMTLLDLNGQLWAAIETKDVARLVKEGATVVMISVNGKQVNA